MRLAVSCPENDPPVSRNRAVGSQQPAVCVVTRRFPACCDTLRHMTRMAALFIVLLATATLRAQAPAAKWWDHINYLASDRMKGRETGSPEHREAAEYIAKHFKDAGLKPGGTDGFFQPVKFRSRKIVEPKSSLDLLRDGKTTSVILGDEATFSMRVCVKQRHSTVDSACSSCASLAFGS